MSSTEQDRSRLFFSSLEDGVFARMLQLGLTGRPIDALLDRLEQGSESCWLDRGIATLTNEDARGAFLDGKATVEKLRSLKEKAKTEFESALLSPESKDEGLAAFAVYLFSIAAAFLHHRVWISGLPRCEVSFHLSEVSGAIEEPWRSFLMRACDALRDHA